MPQTQLAIIVQAIIYTIAAAIIGVIARALYRRRLRRSSTTNLELALEYARWMQNDLNERNHLQSQMSDDQRSWLREAKLAYYDLAERRRTVEALEQAIADKAALETADRHSNA